MSKFKWCTPCVVLLLVSFCAGIAGTDPKGVQATVVEIDAPRLRLIVNEGENLTVGEEYDVIRELRYVAYTEATISNDDYMVDTTWRTTYGKVAGVVITERSGDYYWAEVTSGSVLTDKDVGGVYLARASAERRLLFGVDMGIGSFATDLPKVASKDTPWLYDYSLGEVANGYIGVTLSHRFDLLGVFTLTTLRKEGYELPPDAMDNSTTVFAESSKRRIAASLLLRGYLLTTDRVRPFVAAGIWLPFHEPTPMVRFSTDIGWGYQNAVGTRVQIGAIVKISSRFAINGKAEYLVPFDADFEPRFHILLGPEFALF